MNDHQNTVTAVIYTAILVVLIFQVLVVLVRRRGDSLDVKLNRESQAAADNFHFQIVSYHPKIFATYIIQRNPVPVPASAPLYTHSTSIKLL